FHWRHSRRRRRSRRDSRVVGGDGRMSKDHADTAPRRSRVVRPSIPLAGTHGGDGAAIARALGVDPAAIMDLSASMNPAAQDPLPILRRHLDVAMPRYPDPARAEAALA